MAVLLPTAQFSHINRAFTPRAGCPGMRSPSPDFALGGGHQGTPPDNGSHPRNALGTLDGHTVHERGLLEQGIG
ncbi:MAG: hypothetical protein QOC62_1868 [Mycobacterium sp.]|nr:hypothetical protein [Mycobacterium sp.]